MKARLTALLLLFAGAMLSPAALAANYLQIGVFADEATVKEVRKQLDALGFTTSERRMKVIGRDSIVVLVGPYERTSQALYDLNRLKDNGWTAAVKRYPDEAKAAPPKAPSLRTAMTGFVSVEARAFSDAGLYDSEQAETTLSLALQPEFYLGTSDRKHSIAFVPFVRAGDVDDERNHADVRELMWINVFGDVELRLGVGKVFWGVTESLHIVDVINQIDLVENIDGDEKLGQPLAGLSWASPMGTWDLFALPYFRERTFPGAKGRFRSSLLIDTQQEALYESADKEQHLDWAVRWSNYFGDWDVGLSHFSGTSREPGFVAGLNSLGQPVVLIPQYNLMDQTGLTVQATLGDWLLKLEATSTEEKQQRYSEAVAGFEYTHVGLLGSNMDLGLLLEYLYDERDALATSPYEDDVMLGLRWVFNDMQSTEILMGAIYDLDGTATTSSIEASRRLGQNWKLAFEYRGFHAIEPGDTLLYQWRNDSYMQLDLSYYF